MRTNKYNKKQNKSKIIIKSNNINVVANRNGENN